MGVAVEVKLPGQVEPDVLAFPALESDAFGNGSQLLDERLDGRLSRLRDEGKLGQTVVLHLNGELRAKRIAAAGIGPREDVDADALRTAASAVARAMASVGGTVAWLLDESLPVPLEEQTRAPL